MFPAHVEKSPNEAMRAVGGSTASRSTAVIHDRTGLLVSIIALSFSLVALTIVIMAVADLKDQVIQAQTETRIMNDYLAENGIHLEENRHGR